MRYSVDQRKFVVTQYLLNNENLNAVGPLFTRQFGIPPPRKDSMMAMVRKWNEHGTVHDRIKGISGRYPDVTDGCNIQRVRDEFGNNPNQSIKRASQILDISTFSVHRILKKKLVWKPYKTQKRHFLPVRCERPRVLKAGCLLNALNDNPDLLEKIWFSDESHFELVSSLNKQNNRHWGPEQPYNIIQRPLHPAKTTAWGAISANGKNTKTHKIRCGVLNFGRRDYTHGYYRARVLLKAYPGVNYHMHFSIENNLLLVS